MQERLFTGCTAATMAGNAPYGLVEDAAIVTRGGAIAWVGTSADLPREFSGHEAVDLHGALVTPALLECHSHLVFGGDRAAEFAMRLGGASYEEIARAGGGIRSTVTATRESREEDLLASALRRVDDLLADGVAVIEVKSGYGLSVEQEIRMLRVARQIEQNRPVRIMTTWLAAHALPAEYAERSDDYIEDVVIAGLRQAKAEDLVDAVDGFCENIGFTPPQVRRVFEVARELCLPVKLHAEQLSDLKGAVLASEFNALSADHLEYLAPEDAAHMAKSGTVAVLLPGAYFMLRETQLPPIEALREAGVRMAVATDANPGSSPMSSLRLAMGMACTLFRLTPEEALAGATRNAAAALGIGSEYGTIEPGKRAQLAVWDAGHPDFLSYWLGGNLLRGRIIDGEFHER